MLIELFVINGVFKSQKLNNFSSIGILHVKSNGMWLGY